MADNVELDAGTGGDVIAADDIGGVKYARNKLTLGADGVNDGDVSSSNPMPVTGTGTAGTANAGVVTVQGIASMTPILAAGSGTAGTADSGVVTVQGIASMTPIQVGDNSTSLTVDNTDITASATSLAIIDDWDETDRAKVNLIAGQVGIAGDYGVVSANTVRVSLASDVGLPTGSNQIGKLAVNNGVDIGDVTINNAAGASAVYIQDGGNTITVDGTVTAISGTTVTEDAASAGGESLTLIGGTRNDSAVSQTSQNGDYGTFAIDAAGRMGIADLGGSITVDNGGTFAVQATLQAGSASIGILGANSGVDIGDVTINNASGGSAVNIQDGGNVISVDDNSSSLTVDNGGTFATQDSQVLADNAGFTDGTTKLFMSGYIYDDVAGTALTENDAAAPRISANRATVGVIEDGATRARYATVTATNALKVDASSVAVPVTDNSSSLTVDFSGQITEDAASAGGETLVPIGGTRNDSAVNQTSTNGDYGTFAIDSAGRMGIADLGGSISIDDNASSISVDWAGTAPVTGSGTATGALRVELANNGTGLVGLNAGTNNIGDVDVLSIAAGTNTIGNVGLVPRTSGGLTIYRNLDVDETEDEIKGSAGQLYWIHAMNMSNAPLYLKFWNATAANVTVGTTTPVLTVPLPTQGNTNGAGTQINIPQGLVFDTAMTVGATTGVLDNSTGAPGTNEVIINLGYA